MKHHYNKLLFFSFLLSVIITFNGCDYKTTTVGYQYRIFVVADSLVWLDLKDDIEQTFESIVYTPHTEKSFYITWTPFEKLNEFKERMNVFIIGTEDGNGEASNYLKKVLPEEFKSGARENKYFYLFKDDMFARMQIGLIMFAKDCAAFKDNFNMLKSEIFNTFSKKYYARLEKTMFYKGERKDTESYLAENFGWKVRVQHDYFIAIQDVEKDYVWLRRLDPDRWLSVWKVTGDSAALETDSIFQIRNKVLGEYYQGDCVVEEESYLTETEFNGQTTKKIIGLWRNDSLLIGGPFRTYIVHNKQDSSVYFVDIAVMAPTKNKKSYLDQLEVIANTFEIVKDIN